MSELASRLSALANPQPGPKCYVALLLADLAETDPQGRDALVASIDDHSLNATILAQALADAGYGIKTHSIRRHRKRGTGNGCACA